MTTVRYYDSMEGAVENNTDPIPITPEAIKARQRAIREGRLIVVDPQDPQDPGRVPVVRCVGCEFQTPMVDDTSGAAPFPLQPQDGEPGRFSDFGASRPRHTFTNELGQSVAAYIWYVDVTPVSGACKPSGNNCVEQSQCAFIIEFGLTLSIEPTDAALATTAPNISITNPITGSPTSYTAPVSSRSTKASNGGNSTSADYEFIYSIAVACDDDTPVDLSVVDMAPVPQSGSLTPSGDPGQTMTITLPCGQCTRVY